MHFEFLGTGSAFTLKNWQTNFLLRVGNKRLLIDCGGDIRHALAEAGYTHRHIDEVYISHQHADHIGGLEWLAFMSYFDKDCGIISLHEPDELEIWHDHLKESIQFLVGRQAGAMDFFDWDVLSIPDPNNTEGLEPEIFEFGHLKLQPVPVRHVPGEPDGADMISFGLRIWGPEEPKVFWTSDTIFDPDGLMKHYEWADHIIHDCETTMSQTPDGVGLPQSIKSGVHPHFSDLSTLPEEIKEKMFLVHYQDNVLDENGSVDRDWVVQAYSRGFAGFVEPKSELVLVPPEA